MQSNIRERFETLLQLEETDRLFEKKINGLPFWAFMRHELYRVVLMPDTYRDRASLLQVTRRERTLFALAESFSYFFKTPIKGKCDLVFSGTHRQYSGQEAYIQPIAEVLANEYRILFLSRGDMNSKNDRIHFFNEKMIGPATTFLSKINRIKRKDVTEICRVAKLIESNFGIPVEVFWEVFNTRFRKKQIEIWRYIRIFRRVKPKTLVYVNDNMNLSIVYAARICGIPSVEFPHCTTSQFHPGYNFPKSATVENASICDTICTFGTFWESEMRTPQKVIPVGFPYLENRLEKAPSPMKKKKQILIISNGNKTLAKLAGDLARELKEYTIVFKLRPDEYSGWKKYYENEMSAEQNLKVVDSNDKDLYEYLSESEHIVSVYSTVLYEAINFNVHIFILKDSCYFHMNKLLERKNAFLISSAEEIRRCIESSHLPEKPNPEDIYLFRSIENGAKVIKTIISI